MIDFAKKKIVDALVEVKGYGVIRSEKACWFTQNKGVTEAEQWIEANKNDPDIDKPLRLPKEDPSTNAGASGDTANADATAMEVDQEGGGDGTNAAEDPNATENGQFLKEKCNYDHIMCRLVHTA